MHNLNQKTFKTAGVLTLLAVSLLGCKDTEVSQETLNKAITTAENIVEVAKEAQTAVAQAENKVTGALKEASLNTTVVKNEGDVSCRVVGVSDGDTFTCLADGNEQIRVRLKNIDAPETKQDFSQVSRQALADLVFQKEVILSETEKDRYGRTVALVHVDKTGNLLTVNEFLVEEGHAWAYVDYIKGAENKEKYTKLEHKALSSGAGLWAQNNPTPPWEFRKQKKSK